MKVNERLGFFTSKDIRVVVINGESPLTNKFWVERRRIEIEVYSDPGMNLANMLVGTRDLNDTSLKCSDVLISGGNVVVSNPGVVVLDAQGVLKSKLHIPDFNQITASVKDVERLVGLSG